jgi:hypothetical protein
MRMYGHPGSLLIYDAGRETVVKALLEMDAGIKSLEQQLRTMRSAGTSETFLIGKAGRVEDRLSCVEEP